MKIRENKGFKAGGGAGIFVPKKSTVGFKSRTKIESFFESI